jgi:hypothetical protein
MDDAGAVDRVNIGAVLPTMGGVGIVNAFEVDSATTDMKNKAKTKHLEESMIVACLECFKIIL